jgi:hypothetical protein
MYNFLSVCGLMPKNRYLQDVVQFMLDNIMVCLLPRLRFSAWEQCGAL